MKYYQKLKIKNNKNNFINKIIIHLISIKNKIHNIFKKWKNPTQIMKNIPQAK